VANLTNLLRGPDLSELSPALIRNRYKTEQWLRFEVLTAVNMSMLVFWVVTPRGLIFRYQRFGETCCVHLQTHATDTRNIVLSVLVFWVVTPCGLVDRYTLSPYSALKIETVCFSETVVYTYKSKSTQP
jgi:hypothetical protein